MRKLTWFRQIAGIILCMCPANERRHIVASSPIGWEHTQNDLWIVDQKTSLFYQSDISVDDPKTWNTLDYCILTFTSANDNQNYIDNFLDPGVHLTHD